MNFSGSFIVVGLFSFLSFMQVGYTLLEALSAAVMGLIVGALLGVSLRRGRGTVVLALTGLVGFGMGGLVAAALQGSLRIPRGPGSLGRAQCSEPLKESLGEHY